MKMFWKGKKLGENSAQNILIRVKPPTPTTPTKKKDLGKVFFVVVARLLLLFQRCLMIFHPQLVSDK